MFNGVAPMLGRLVSKALKPFFPHGSGWSMPSAQTYVVNLIRQIEESQEARSLIANSVAYPAITWLCDHLYQVEPRVYRRTSDGTETPIYDHELITLFSKASRDTSFHQLLEESLVDFLEHGNAYWLKIRSRSGRLVGLRALTAWRVEPRFPYDGSVFVSHYEVNLDHEIVNFPEREIVHFRDRKNPLNERKGLSRLQYASNAIKSHEATEKYNQSIVRLGGVNGVLFSKKNAQSPDIGKAGADSIKQQIADRIEEGTFVPTIIDTEISTSTWGFTPDQMNLDKIPLNTELTISSAIGVSPKVYGGAASQLDSTYANSEEARKGAWSRLEAILARFASVITVAILREEFEADETVCFEFSLDNVDAVQEQVNARCKRAQDLYQSNMITLNESREIVGLDKLSDAVGNLFYYQLERKPNVN